MRKYLARRLAQSVFVLWAAFTLSFAVLYLLPGDPVSIMAAGGGETNDIGPEQLAELRKSYGFDKPVVEQYGTQLRHALQGDFGRSVQSGDGVGHLIASNLPATLELTSAALLLALVLGAGVALIGTYTRWRWLRQALLSLAGARSLRTFVPGGPGAGAVLLVPLGTARRPSATRASAAWSCR